MGDGGDEHLFASSRNPTKTILEPHTDYSKVDMLSPRYKSVNFDTHLRSIFRMGDGGDAHLFARVCELEEQVLLGQS